MFQMLPVVERFADVMTARAAVAAPDFRRLATSGRDGANAILRDAHGDRSARGVMPGVGEMKEWLRKAATVPRLMVAGDPDWLLWYERVGTPKARAGARPNDGRITETGPVPPPVPVASRSS